MDTYSIEQRDEQLLSTSARIVYTLSFSQAAQHIVHIEMSVECEPDDDNVIFSLPNWLPGSYKIRDFVSNQGDVTAYDEKGNPLPIEWLEKHRLNVVTRSCDRITLNYVYYGFERSVRHSHISRFHAFVNPANCLMCVEGRLNEIHHVIFDHPWEQLTTSLSPVDEKRYGALNYDILIDSPIEIGEYFYRSYEMHGAMHEVVVTGEGDYDPEWLTEQTKRIVEKGVELWGKLPYDRYVFFIQLFPKLYGGLEHSRCSVSMFDPQVFREKPKIAKLLSLLCHEYFHTWNVKRIRPIELGPFDYNRENYTSMLWLVEGATSYYDDLMAYRCGFYTESEYLNVLSTFHITALLDVPGRTSMSIKDSSFLSWVKLYVRTSDSNNRFPSYYLKGGVIFLLLDLLIIDRSNGTKSLDDAMRGLLRRYEERPGVGVTEEEVIRIVEDTTGVKIGETFQSWLNGTEPLPIEEMFRPLGIALEEKEVEVSDTFGEDLRFVDPATKDWLGFSLVEADGKLLVKQVWKDSPAERSGIGADDEIIALNGIRMSTSQDWKGQMRKKRGDREISLLCSSDGKIYETTVTIEKKIAFQLKKMEGVSPENEVRLNKWLAR